MRGSLSEETVNTVLNVLGRYPFAEVAQTINLIQQDWKPIVEKKETARGKSREMAEE